MLTLLTGKPGAGKSQLLVKRFILDVRQDKDAAVSQRPIYTNISGLEAAEIQRRVSGPLVLQAPDDWRSTPEGSLCIYDEAQFLFPATGTPGAPTDPRLIELATHRKGGRDLVMATQDGTLVHHWARKFVGQHVHVHRPNNMASSIVYQWNDYRSNPLDHFAVKDADESRFAHDPKVWELYESATIHTHKFKMPAGSRWIIRASIVLALAILGSLAWVAFGLNGDSQADAASGKHSIKTGQKVIPAENVKAVAMALNDDKPVLSPAYAWRTSAATVEPINGCVASASRCRCFDFEGRLLDLEIDQCKRLASGQDMMPLDLNRFQSGGDGRRASSKPSGDAAPSEPVDFIGRAKSMLTGEGGGGRASPQGAGPPANTQSNTSVMSSPQVGAYGDIASRVGQPSTGDMSPVTMD